MPKSTTPWWIDTSPERGKSLLGDLSMAINSHGDSERATREWESWVRDADEAELEAVAATSPNARAVIRETLKNQKESSR